MMTPSTILRKLFLGGTWFVGLRDYLNEKERKYIKVEVPKGQWLADPFLVENEGRHFLFCEQYFNKKHKASIGCFEIVEGEAINNRIIIDNPYHMSYPCVFKHNGDFYMIPESSANKTIDIYKANTFPYEWVHEKSLLIGERFVDSTVYLSDGDYYLISYTKVSEGWDLVVFLLNMDMLSLTEISRYHYKRNIGRPGGFLFQESGLIRPAQDCSKKYGEALILYSVDQITKTSYLEHPYKRIEAKDVKFPKKIDRIHTLNRDNRYEVIDVFKDEFDLLHGFNIFKRAYLKH